MSRIEFDQLSDNIVKVFIPQDTPIEIVNQLVKSLVDKGLVEDLQKSTLSTRYFHRPQDRLSVKADELIKSLKRLCKDDEPYWSPKAQLAHQAKLKQQDYNKRQAKIGTPAIAPSSTQNIKPEGPKMFDSTPAASVTAGGTGKRYAYIGDKVKKEENDENDDQSVNKSNYKGAKGVSEYNAADNARRKKRNTGSQTGFGPNVNTKEYTTAKYHNQYPQTSAEQRRPGKPKIYTDEEKSMFAAKLGIGVSRPKAQEAVKKSWGQHLPFPSANEELMRLAKETAQSGEDVMANQLANMMNSKSMLNPKFRQPTSEEMVMAGEQMGLGVKEDMAKSEEQQWNGTINNWLANATKPISQRFASEEEEIAYWNSIKVADIDSGDSGY